MMTVPSRSLVKNSASILVVYEDSTEEDLVEKNKGSEAKKNLSFRPFLLVEK